MTIKDIFVKNDSGNGFTVNVSSFELNAKDEALAEKLNEQKELIMNRSTALAVISESDFKEKQSEIAKAIAHDAEIFGVVADELISMRKLAGQIQKERDTLLEFVVKEVLNATEDENE